MQFLWSKKEKETRFFDIDSSNTIVFNAERNLFYVFTSKKFISHDFTQ